MKLRLSTPRALGTTSLAMLESLLLLAFSTTSLGRLRRLVGKAPSRSLCRTSRT